MVSNAEWIKRIEVHHPDKKNLFSSRLHAGEVEAIHTLVPVIVHGT